ncbi:MAG: DUF1127 domain-containing protein [Pseudomonadota bacterium]
MPGLPIDLPATIQPQGALGLPRVGALLRGLLQRVLRWQDRLRQRRRLQALPDHMLKDIGVSREDALEEASKPFWS